MNKKLLISGDFHVTELEGSVPFHDCVRIFNGLPYLGLPLGFKDGEWLGGFVVRIEEKKEKPDEQKR